MSHFPCYLRFLAIFQFLQCVFSFSRFSFSSFVSFLKLFQVLSVCVSFSTVFSVSSHIPGPAVCVCVCVCVCFHVFSVFLPYARSYSVHFSRFSVFFAIFHFLPCEFLNFLICQFSRHITGPTV